MEVEARLGITPRVSFVEVAMNQFSDHLNEFFHRLTVRRHLRLMANGDQQTAFFSDIEI